MTKQIKLPSKTFLLGEYLALVGEPCLILTSPPYFTLDIIMSDKPAIHGIPNGSPAMKFVNDHHDYFSQYELRFNDPHNGAGGFGASSAQFLSVYILHEQQGNVDHNNWQQLNLEDLLSCYKKYAWAGKGMPPSGADIISQLFGDITYYDRNNAYVETLKWPFPNHDFLLLRTNNKLATHEHLLELDEFKIRKLPNLASKAKQCIAKKDLAGFIKCIKQFSNALQEQNLVANKTQFLLEELNNHKGVCASKGCGALGADVIFVLCESKNRHDIEKYYAELNSIVHSA